MSSFVVSARKYRPAMFDSVVGQAHVTTTLKNAIKNNHLAQAFLFTGPRGVGKTTCARILAKTINCTNITDGTEACNQCESCLSFNGGQSLNIFELDAASNNSVDDIRNLVDQVRFAPASGKFKIYIIDEVHMLSAAAFNAFLKTLEEPPSYAIFILATTEKHKIIPTILSRCQIFDFNRIQIEDIAKHLSEIATKETIEADTDALHIIAQKADGALRDALSIFDQIVSYAGNKITYKDVISNLNILDYDYYFRLTDDIVKGNVSQILLTFSELLSEGFDSHNFINGLSNHFRDLLVCKDEVTLQLLEVSAGIKEKYKAQSKMCDVNHLLKLIEICNRCDVEYRSAKNQRLHVEIALLKMCAANTSAIQQTAQPLAAAKPTQPVSAQQPPAAPQTKPATPNEPQQDIKKPATPAQPITQTTTPPVTAPKTSLTGISLSALSAKPKPADDDAEKKKITDSSDVIVEDKPLTETNVYATWSALAKLMDEKGKKNVSVTLLSRKPELRDNNLIEFAVTNKVQEEELKLLKVDLLHFLKTQLHNSNIQLQTRIIETAQEPAKAYTAKDKFKKMAEKNPALETLKKRFDLDLDY
jgi:DNA polymerase-3 subunit gamma/tau